MVALSTGKQLMVCLTHTRTHTGIMVTLSTTGKQLMVCLTHMHTPIIRMIVDIWGLINEHSKFYVGGRVTKIC